MHTEETTHSPNLSQTQQVWCSISAVYSHKMTHGIVAPLHRTKIRSIKLFVYLNLPLNSEGTIVDGSVKIPNCTGCNVIESTEIFASS